MNGNKLSCRDWLIIKGDQWRILDFPEEGRPTPEGGVGEAPAYCLTNFSWKLHENKEILVQRRHASLVLLLDLYLHHIYLIYDSFKTSK